MKFPLLSPFETMTGAKPKPARILCEVLGVPIDAITEQEAVNRILAWSQQRESRYVCICNVHSVVTASADDRFRQVLVGADMATPDGAPIAWMLRRLGISGQSRVSGPDLMLRYCDHAASTGEKIFLLGSTAATLAALQEKLQKRWPDLTIAGSISPPFRPLTADEDAEIVEAINTSGAGTIWVSLGCPKQEHWMAAHRGRIRGVMLGVGAAFDFHAGSVKRAPLWMQRTGFEWLHRLLSEPGRLWKRYLLTNSRFMLLAAWQLLRQR